ncbi:MAG: hypothetical protein RJQ07_02835 [Pseudomonadales bacterium]
MTPEEIINATTPQVAGLIEKILQVEREYQHFQNIESSRQLETEICNKLAKLIDEEVRKNEA